MSTFRKNRGADKSRRAPTREPLPTILIVCEGQRTEPQYFTGLMLNAENSRVTIQIHDKHGAPITLVQMAKELKDAARDKAARAGDDNLAFDSVWCVFDMDDHPRVGQAKEMARDNEIDIALSNPCFELWLLVHFRKNPGMQDRKVIVKMLKTFVPEYEKHVKYEVFRDGHQHAVGEAKAMDTIATNTSNIDGNPTTGVYRLTEIILRK